MGSIIIYFYAFQFNLLKNEYCTDKIDLNDTAELHDPFIGQGVSPANVIQF